MIRPTSKEQIGIFLLLAVVAVNLIVALRFYNLATIKISDFFFWQAQKNELFNPNKRY